MEKARETIAKIRQKQIRTHIDKKYVCYVKNSDLPTGSTEEDKNVIRFELSYIKYFK